MTDPPYCQLHASYDPKYDIGYIYIKETIENGEVRHSYRIIVDAGGELILDLDDHGHIVGIEVIDVRVIMPALIKGDDDVSEVS